MIGAVHQKVATHLVKIQTAGDQIQTVGEIVLIREILKHQDKGKINYPWVAGRGRPSLHGGVPKIFFESVHGPSASRTEADDGPNKFRPKRTVADAGREWTKSVP